MNSMSRIDLTVLLLALGANQWSAVARGHSDLFLADVGGRVAVGGANELGEPEENFDLTTQVFEGVMIADFPPIGPADYGRDEPGVFALAAGSAAFPAGAAALPGSAAVSVSLSSFSVGGPSGTLFYWNGVGAVDFQPIAAAQPGVSLTIEPDPIGTTSGSGVLHEHAVFQLDNGGPGAPADGVYLVAPTVSVPGLTSSRPFYMVFLADALLMDEDAAEELEDALEMGQFVVHGKDFGFLEEAVDFVASQLVVPEPGTALLAVFAAAMAVALGRKRSNG